MECSSQLDEQRSFTQLQHLQKLTRLQLHLQRLHHLGRPQYQMSPDQGTMWPYLSQALPRSLVQRSKKPALSARSAHMEPFLMMLCISSSRHPLYMQSIWRYSCIIDGA